MLIHHLEHVGRRKVLDARPAQVVIAAAARVLPFGEHATLDRLLQPCGFVLFEALQVIEPVQVQQLSDLFDDFDGVGDAA